MERIKLFDGPTTDEVQKKLDDWTLSQKDKDFAIILVGPFMVNTISDGVGKIVKSCTVAVVYDDEPCDCGDDEDEERGFQPRPHKKK